MHETPRDPGPAKQPRQWHRFGFYDGTLPATSAALAAKIAKRFGVRHVEGLSLAKRQQGYFVAQSVGQPMDNATAENVLLALHEVGVYDWRTRRFFIEPDSDRAQERPAKDADTPPTDQFPAVARPREDGSGGQGDGSSAI